MVTRVMWQPPDDLETWFGFEPGQKLPWFTMTIYLFVAARELVKYQALAFFVFGSTAMHRLNV